MGFCLPGSCINVGTETVTQAVVLSIASPRPNPAGSQAQPIKIFPLIVTEFPVVSSLGHRLICRSEVSSQTPPWGRQRCAHLGTSRRRYPEWTRCGELYREASGIWEDTRAWLGPDLSSADPVTFRINHVCLPMNVWLGVQIRGPPPKLPSVVRLELVEEAWAAISEGKKAWPGHPGRVPWRAGPRDRVWRDRSTLL